MKGPLVSLLFTERERLKGWLTLTLCSQLTSFSLRQAGSAHDRELVYVLQYTHQAYVLGEMTSRTSWPGAGKQTLIAEWLLWWRIVCQAPQSGLWVESYVMETRQIDTNNRKHSALPECNVFKRCMLARKTGLFSHAFSSLKGWAMERWELCVFLLLLHGTLNLTTPHTVKTNPCWKALVPGAQLCYHKWNKTSHCGELKAVWQPACCSFISLLILI